MRGLLLLEGRTKATMTLLQRRTKKQKPCQLGQERLRLGMQPFLLVLLLLLLLLCVLCVVFVWGVLESCASSFPSPFRQRSPPSTPDAHDPDLCPPDQANYACCARAP